jgi:hypothetical protein
VLKSIKDCSLALPVVVGTFLNCAWRVQDSWDGVLMAAINCGNFLFLLALIRWCREIIPRWPVSCRLFASRCVPLFLNQQQSPFIYCFLIVLGWSYYDRTWFSGPCKEEIVIIILTVLGWPSPGTLSSLQPLMGLLFCLWGLVAVRIAHCMVKWWSTSEWFQVRFSPWPQKALNFSDFLHVR